MKRSITISLVAISSIYLFFTAFASASEAPVIRTENPVKIAVIGLTHTHVHWIFESAKKESSFEIIGIVEKNHELAKRYCEQHHYPLSKVYASMSALLEQEPETEAFAAFGSIKEHIEVVEFAAPRAINVMVEKPLAVNMEHANRMASLAKTHQIELLVNYETTWYPTNYQAFSTLHSGEIGEIRKVVIHDGHKGPKKLGINSEFLDWLLDPEQNGGGAITDFGCYGANLMTWLLNGDKPNTVTAVTQQLQAENNPLVDDEATIILTYDGCQAVIQASWNWPIGRKDMDIYGLTGTVSALNRHELRIRHSKGYDGFEEQKKSLNELDPPYHDPFAYFAAVIREEIEPPAFALSSIENNLIVMEILDAAIRSAKTGSTVYLKPLDN